MLRPATQWSAVTLRFSALVLASVSLRAHDEWNNLHITNASRAEYVYPFDGRSPKVGASLLNHHEIPGPEVIFALDVNGQRDTAGMFTAFPNGGNILVGPDGFAFATATTGAIYEGRAGPAPAVGESREYTFQFIFRLAPGASPPPGQPHAPAASYTQEAKVRFTNLGETPNLVGPMPLTGTVRLASAPGTPGVRVEVGTPYSGWFPVATAPGANAATHTFAQGLLSRADWHVRISADGHDSRIVALGHPNDPRPPLDLTLSPAAALDLDYRRAHAISTSTGFWRGAVSESEGTFVVFPGQETWPAASSDANARALRTAGRIYKHRFDGTRLWEHAPGWETWAGDMSLDGRFVAYALQPATHAFYVPTENKLVLLDGATGSVLWTKSATPTDAAVGRRIDALELAFSPDARWIAVGSASGTVTLVDRATGNFAWTIPGSGAATFGQIRKLRFSADSQFLFCGSGDSNVRKLRVADGVVLWKAFAGGWPTINGLDLAPDGAWLVAGTRSLDATLIRTSDGLVQWQRETQYADAVFSPDGRHVATAGGQIYRTLDGSLAGMTKAAAATRFTPDGNGVLQLGAEPKLYDLGGKLLRTFEASGLENSSAVQPPWTHLTADGRYLLLAARNHTAPPQTGIAIYERRSAAASAPAAPAITAQPLAQTVIASRPVVLTVSATGVGPLNYQWRKNGTPIVGAVNPTLSFAAPSAADAGTYTCVVGNVAGTITSAAAAIDVVSPNPADPARLTNLAVRTTVGSTPLIVGFAIGGAGTGGTKPLLIRGAGPALVGLGVTNALADPRMELFSGTASVLANDNWANSTSISTMATQVGAFPFGANSRDAALSATAVGGSYTVQLSSADATAGTALAEIYDASNGYTASTPRLINLSARTEVAAGNLLIAGFVVAGPAAKLVLIRGIGPGLAQFGVPNALANPQLALFRETTRLAANDNWHDAANAVAIAQSAQQVGAFPLVPDSADAALLLSLPPGGYTAQVSGPGSGSALVEVYEVP